MLINHAFIEEQIRISRSRIRRMSRCFRLPLHMTGSRVCSGIWIGFKQGRRVRTSGPWRGLKAYLKPRQQANRRTRRPNLKQDDLPGKLVQCIAVATHQIGFFLLQCFCCGLPIVEFCDVRVILTALFLKYYTQLSLTSDAIDAQHLIIYLPLNPCFVVHR